MTTSILPIRHFLGFFVLGVILVASPLVTAKPEIFSLAKSRGIKVTGCTSCHTSPSGGVATLKPNYRTAYSLDSEGLSRLKNLINGCSKSFLLNSVNFNCERSTAVTGTLGSASTVSASTDVYLVACGPGTDNLAASVNDNGPVKPALVTVQLVKGPVASALSIDSIDGDTLSSPAVALSAKAGNYLLLISKTDSGVIGQESYTANFSCFNKAGSKTATGFKVTQNK
jgi:hypothetical protein